MSDLMSLLSLGSAGITAQNAGISIATNNVANANTEGYSRQRVDLESLLASPFVGGVRSGDPDRMQNNLLASRIRTTAGSLSMSRTFSSAVLDIEQRLGAGTSIQERLGTLFSRINTVSASPTDATARTAAVTATTDLVEGIRDRASELESARGDSNTRIGDSARAATELAARLADANTAIAKTNDPVMRDERDRIAGKLSELVGGDARIDGDGQMRFVLDGGGVLVDGGHAAKLVGTPDAATKDLKLELVDGASRRDVSSGIGGGAIGAELKVRDVTITRAQADLDQLAFDVANSFNATHTANAGLDGVSGRTMFVAPTSLIGAAKALAVDPGLAADPSQLATAAPGSGPGDNTGALALFALANANVATGGKTLTSAAIELSASIGAEASAATSAVTRDTLVADHLAGLRDSLAGVDVQEELTNLARFEHASSAMAKFVSTIDSLLGNLIDRL
ncbi:MAG: flagellar hook-associated protein FlgK [Kofleriaceae bacterium]